MHPKTAARQLRAQLAASGFNPLGQQRALNVVAALRGTDWNTLSARPDHPPLPPNAAAAALQAALATYHVTVTFDWALDITLQLTGNPAGATVSRDDLYVSCGFERERGLLFRLRSAPPTQPWPLLPLPAQLSADLHERLTRSLHLEWTAATGLRVDGLPAPLGLGGQEWLSRLRSAAPGDSVEAEYTSELELQRVTFTRPVATDAAFTYRAQSTFARSYLRRARDSADLSYTSALELAQQGRRYDQFIADTGVDPRGPAALTQSQRTRLHALERQVLATLGHPAPVIRDHVNQWRRDAQVTLTYEPYLTRTAANHPATQAFRDHGWQVTVRESAYHPLAIMLLLTPP